MRSVQLLRVWSGSAQNVRPWQVLHQSYLVFSFRLHDLSSWIHLLLLWVHRYRMYFVKCARWLQCVVPFSRCSHIRPLPRRNVLSKWYLQSSAAYRHYKLPSNLDSWLHEIMYCGLLLSSWNSFRGSMSTRLRLCKCWNDFSNNSSVHGWLLLHRWLI